jgi:hypothetical protein
VDHDVPPVTWTFSTTRRRRVGGVEVEFVQGGEDVFGEAGDVAA